MIVKTAYFILALLSLVGLTSCGHKITSPSEAVSYIADPHNGLKVIDSVGKMEIAMSYRPISLLPREFRELLKTKEKAPCRYYFLLSLSAGHHELLKQMDYKSYSLLVQRLSFEMSDFINVVSTTTKNSMPVQCQLYQTYGVGTSNQLLLSFHRAAGNTEGFTIHVREFGLGTGDLNYRFNTARIRAFEKTLIF